MTIRSIACSLVMSALVAAWPAAQVKKADVPGITNFSRVDATVGCGGATQPAAMAELKKQRFTSVINLRMASEPGAEIDASRAAAQSAGLKYIHLPFDSSNPDPMLVDQFLAVVADTANQPVYIHCASANRVGSVWMIKRALQDGWEIDKAREEAEAIGLSNPRLKTFATEYIQTHKK
jgi:uncharacterized protein (TIGR01244 family)